MPRALCRYKKEHNLFTKTLKNKCRRKLRKKSLKGKYVYDKISEKAY